MKEGPDIARIAALIGDPARANMLTALMGGKALTATRACRARREHAVQTASATSSKLDEGGLLRPRKQGRHRYFSLADDDVARVARRAHGLRRRAGHLRTAPARGTRRCARRASATTTWPARWACALLDSLVAAALSSECGDDGLACPTRPRVRDRRSASTSAIALLERRPLCRECLDWSERRSHLAGSLGRALLSRFEDSGWARREPGTRVVAFSPQGAAAFARAFPLEAR